jgi:pilus assembly protein CpaC
MRSGRGAAKVIALVVFIIVILVATPQAQQQASFTGSPGAISAGPAALAPDATSVDLLVGRSTILNVGATISRVSLTVPDVADALVTAPSQLLIHGKAPGTISLFVWDRAGGIKTYEVNVRRDLKQLQEQLTQLFPGEPIAVAGNGKDVVLSGTVSSKYAIDKAADVAAGYVEKKENVVNLLKQQEGVASNQVMLRVRFAEVSRTALQELGVNLFTGATGNNNLLARTTTQQFAAPDYSNLSSTRTDNNTVTSASGTLSLSDFLNIFLFSNKYNVGAVVRALQQKGVFQSLAEPNLIASNGKEASFLAGGEYPYPVVQPSSGGNSVTIQFKEFGVRLTFTPTVLAGDLISLHVKPEVSSLDFTNGLILDGFHVPALTTRRTETELELQDGQTFAIAGLLNNTVNSTMSKIPGIGDIPVLGYLFKSKAYNKAETELVVMITPTIVRKGSTGVSEGLPSIVEPYLTAPGKTMPQPAPYVGSPAYPPGAPKQKKEPTPAPAPASSGGSAPASSGGSTPSSSGGSAPSPSAAPSAAPQQPLATAPVLMTGTSPSAPAPAASASPSPAASALASEPAARPPAPLAQAVAQTPAREPSAAAVAPSANASQAAEPQAAAGAQSSTQKPQDAPIDPKAAKKAAAAQAAADRKAEAEKAAADKEAAKQQAAADKKAAEDKKIADKKAADEKARQDKLDAERAKQEAIAKQKADEEQRKKDEEQKKKDKALADAAARLKAAQDAYARAKGNG